MINNDTDKITTTDITTDNTDSNFCLPGFYLIYDKNGKSICKECSIKNCDICFGNGYSDICISCFPNLIPNYKNYILTEMKMC